MMPNNPSIEKLTQFRLAGNASKSAFSLDHPLTSSANKRSKTHSESGKQAKAALDPHKHHKAKHHKAKHHKKQKHVTRFLFSPAAGNGVQFANFADISSLKLNGNSSQAGNVLRLTSAQKNQAGSAFVKTPYTISSDTSFNTRFQFRLSGGDGNNGADGMTFMLQNSAAGVNTLGTVGGGEGYSTIGNSLAIEFDSFKSGWDSRANQVSLLKNGNERAPLATANTPMDLNNSGALNAWIDYDGATNQLSVFLANNTTKPASALLKTQVDITSVGTQAFVGFSAGTGGLTNLQDVVNWQFTTSIPAPPPPANVIQATNSSETITGTTGNDTVSYANASDGIIADLGSGFASRIARIMPLGDSITQGVTDRTTDPNRIGNGGYRVILSKKFTSNGLQADFVGTRSNGTLKGDPAFTDIEHEGHPGQTIEYLTSNATDGGIASYLSATRPDVVLLMAGTNDLFQKEPDSQFTSAVQMRDRLGLLIDKAFQNSPNLRVIVSTISPIQFDTLTQSDLPAGSTDLAAQRAAQVKRVKDYNELLPGLVAAKKQAGKSIDFVDMFSSSVPGALNVSSDISPKALDTGVHPTAQGYDKIGNFWFNSLNTTIGTAQGTYKVDQDTLVNIKNIIGSGFNDTIISGSGSNVLTGNGGIDTFFYHASSDGNDTITDFGTDDRFQISAAGFGSGLTAGVALSATPASTGVFVNGSSAISGNATFLYSGGSLWFDADGTGAGSQVKIADLSTQPASLSASQFTIVA